MGPDTTLSDPTGRRPAGPVPRFSPALIGPDEQAREILGTALGVVAPGAIPLRDGSVRLTGDDDVLPARIVERLRERLARRFADKADEHRALAEAVALLGDSICRARGGSSPADAATTALDRLLDDPGLPPQSRTEAESLLRRIIESDPERAAEPLTPRAADLAREARAITREARVLHTTHPATTASSATTTTSATTASAATTAITSAQARTTGGGRHRRVEERHRAAGQTVATPQVYGSGFVPGGRPDSDPSLTEDEMLAALARVQVSDLGGRITAAPRKLARPQLAVVDTPQGPQHFLVRVESPGRSRVAATDIRAGTSADPHVLRVSPRLADVQLGRVWVHAISHTLQETQAERGGFLHRVRSALGRHGRDRSVAAQYDEFRMLTRDWREASHAGRSTEALERDLRGLATAIGRRGHTAPGLPWETVDVIPAADVPGPAEAPAPNTPAHLRERVAAEVAVLDEAATDLHERAAGKRASAAEAAEQAVEARLKAGKERALQDRAAPERARKLEVEAARTEAKQQRHLQIASAYQQAADRAGTARDSCRALLTEVDADRAGLPALAEAASAQVEEYRRSLARALPPARALHTGAPTGRLPHLTALTERINATLAAHDLAYRFTPELLHRTLRAEFRRVASPDGLVLPVGLAHGDVQDLPQLRLRLRPGELAEVTDPDARMSEMMVGQLEQGGHSVATTATRSTTTRGGFSLRTLLAVLPESSPLKAVSNVVAPGFEYAFGRSRAVTGAATEYALGGAVEDNRGESLLFESSAAWEVQLRDSATGEWSRPETVDSPTARDASTLRLWLSHAYTVPPPDRTTQLTGEPPAAALPEHVATGITGMNELTDKVAAQTRARLGALDTVAYDQIRGLLTEDLPSRLDEATRPGGIGRLVTDQGRPVAYVQVQTRVVRERTRMIGAPSTSHWQERLRVGFSGATGSESFGANASGSVSAGLAVDDVGQTTVDVGPSVSAGRAVSRSDEVTAGGTAIHPSVQRYTGPTQGYVTRLEHTVTVYRVDGDDSFTVDGEGAALLRIPENDAYRYGLPVDEAAVLRSPDGRPLTGPDGQTLLRGDPQPVETPLAAPAWLGGEEHQMRGAGPALVQRVTGADTALTAVLAELSRRGLVPPLDADGRPKLSELPSDEVERASLLQNLERVGQQLSAPRLETGYDQACQGGIPLALVRNRPGRAPETVTLRLALHQRWADATARGLTTSESIVNLDIGSNTSSRSAGRSKRLPWKARLGVGDKGSTTPEGGLSYARASLGRSAAWSAGGTVNQVTLVEGTAPVAVFDVPHTLVVTEITSRGDSAPLAAVDGSARVLLDSELLAPALEAPPFRGLTNSAILDRATIMHLDAGDVLSRLRPELPAATRPDSAAMHHLAAFLNPRNLIAHPEWTHTPYRTRLPVSPAPVTPGQAVAQRGLLPRQASVALTGRIRNHVFLGATSQVVGDINLTLGSFSTTTGRSTGNTVELSGSDGAAGDWKASAAVSRTASTATSRTEASIWGRERLMIETGQQYVFRADVGFAAEVTDREGGTTKQVRLPDGTVVFTVPEREALRLYGRRELDLPPAQVSDAVERFLTGKLELDRRTAAALVPRYLAEKTGDGLAAGHTEERLAAALRTKATVRGPGGKLPDPQALTARPAAVTLPEHYRTTMGAALIENAELTDAAGGQTDLLDQVRRAIEQVSPGSLDGDPVLGESLYGDLAGKRWRGHLDDMLDPRGFVKDYPVKAASTGPGVGPAELLTVRITARFDDTVLADDTTAESATILVQGYDYAERSRTDTRGTGYAANAGYTAEGGLLTGGAGTDRGRSVSATSAEQLTRMQRIGHFSAARVERGVRLVVEVHRTPVRGAATRGRLLQAADRRKPEGTTATVEMSGRLTQLVPRELIGAAPAATSDQHRDHRLVTLPSSYFVEGTTPYPRGEPAADTLFDTVFDRLSRRDMLTAAGVRLHRTELENQLSASARGAAFERIAGDEGHRMVRLAVPGHGGTVVDVRVRAVVSGVERMTASSGEVEIGQVDRSQRTTKTTMQGNRLVPLARSVEGDPGEDVKAGAAAGEQVSERVTDTTGNRNETSMFERGATVTVRVRLDYELSFERRSVNRHGEEKVRRAETIRNAAAGEAYLTMFEHEYDAMLARMESGAPVLPPWEHTWQAARPAAAEERRVTVDEYTGAGTGEMRHQPYRPLVAALAEARADGVVIALDVRDREGNPRSYKAYPDGTMTGVDDGGFAAAFATLNPRLALLAEGRVDLRELYNTAPRSDRFTPVVTDALRHSGVPDSLIDEAVHAVAPQRAVIRSEAGARRTVGGTTTGPAYPGQGVSV